MDLSLGNFGILIEEQDGSPSGFCTKLIASNASLTNNGDGSFTLVSGGGVSDHGALTGKLDDDHTQYGLLAGRAGGQTLIGGAASGEGLTLSSTAHATKGLVSIGGILYVDEVNNRVGIGENAPTADFEINSTGGENIYVYRYATSANPPGIKFWKARGTEGSPAVANDGDDSGKVEAWVYARNQGDTDDAFVRTGMMICEVDGVDAQGRVGGRIEFYTSAGVSVTPGEKFSIGKDSIEVYKIATATAVTQYDSWDFRFRASVWDTDNVQAEDRTMYWTLNAGSGVDGSEPYYLSLYDNGGAEMIRVDPLTPAFLVPDYLLHLGDTNTGFRFQVDRITYYAGGIVWMDMYEDVQDVLYIGNGALGVGGTDIDVYIGTNNAIQIAGDTGNITISDQMNLDKTDTATAGTQYPSQDLILTGSVWDTTNTQAEDRAISISNICGSGANGSEPYRLAIEDNDGNEFFTLDGLNQRIGILTDSPSYEVHISTSASVPQLVLESTHATGHGVIMAIGATSGRLRLRASGYGTAAYRNYEFSSLGGEFSVNCLADDWASYTFENILVCNPVGKVGIAGKSVPTVGLHVGTGVVSNGISSTSDLFVTGDAEIDGTVYLDGRLKLKETGSQDLYSYEADVADDGSIDLPDSLAGFVLVTFDEGGDYAFCSITDAGVVTLISNSANVVNTDTDTQYCIFDNGTNVRIRNRIGSEKNIKVIAFIG